MIADNKLAEQAGWDREILAIELGELIDLLPAEGFDISLTGFEAPEIDQLLGDMAPSRAEPEDHLPALPKNPTTRRGDLWQLSQFVLVTLHLFAAITSASFSGVREERSFARKARTSD